MTPNNRNHLILGSLGGSLVAGGIVIVALSSSVPEFIGGVMTGFGVVVVVWALRSRA